MSLIAELKRRNVFRVSLAYLALGWVVMQVTSTVAPMLHLPQWIGPVVLWIGVIGFPFVVMFAWIYELTPDGLRRERELDRAASDTHVTARRLDYVVIALLATAIGLYAWGQFRPAAGVQSPFLDQPAPTATRDSAVLDRSVAVLPFVDMSAGKDQEYFADGISEELLNLLAKVPEIRVIARTSSFSFKGKEVDIAEIARRLNVANVLEGSVRTSGDKVRITAQLVRASDSSHLWSETYDRQLTDVFAVQDEIAAAVVAQMKVSLLGAAPKARATDPKAYALFLQAREVSRQNNAAAYERAIALYRQALQIDPTYAPAWNGLALVHFGQVGIDVLTPEQGLVLGRDAASQALERDPSFAPSYGSLALFEGFIERDYQAAARHLEQGLALDPANLEVMGAACKVTRRLGRMDLAVEICEYVVSRDPVNTEAYDGLARAYRYSGRLDDAIAAHRKLLSLMPDAGREHSALGNVLLQKGDAEGALVEYRKEPIENFRLMGLTAAYHALGRQAESDAAFAVYPTFAVLHDDPRWLPLLRRLGMAPEQLAAVKFDVRVPKQ